MNKILYTSPYIDRCTELRSNKSYLNEVISKKNSRFIPVWGSKNIFLKSNEDIEPLILKKNEIDSFFSQYEVNDLILLGKFKNIFYFSINLAKFIKSLPSKINKKEIICEELRVYGKNLNELDSSFLALAKGMTYWQINNQYCGSCGSKNIVKEGGFVLFCQNTNCNKNHFPRTDPAIITLISYKDEILLARSPRFPEKMYSTLAGFVEPGESLEQALKREVFEEVGINVKNISYFGSQPWPFPASLMLGFFAEAKNKDLNIDHNEIEDANWFKLNNLQELSHPDILNGFKLPRVDSIARRLVNHWIVNKGF